MKRLSTTTIFSLATLTLLASITGAQKQGRPYSNKSIKELVHELKKGDKKTHRRMINELLERKPETQEDKDFLLQSLGQDDPETESAIMIALAKGKERRAVPKLIERLKHRNVDVQEAAIEALAEIGDEAALKPLEETLDRQFHFGRPHPISKFGAKALTHLVKKADEFRRPQVAAKLADQQLNRHRTVAATIGAIQDRAAIPELISLLRHESPDVRMNAAKALAGMKVKEAEPEIEKLLADPDEEVKLRALGILLPTDRARFLPIAARFIKEGKATVKGPTIDLLGDLRISEAVPHLEALLTDSYDRTRYRAARSLRKITGKDYPYKKTQQTEDIERDAKRWELIRQGRLEESRKYDPPDRETPEEKREMVEKLRKAGLLAPDTTRP